MDKFLITPKSHNKVTGPMMVTTSPRQTCPRSCPLRKGSSSPLAGSCYAESGFLGGFIWTKLDQLPVGGSFNRGHIKIRSFNELLEAVRALKSGEIWRHNQAGDLPSQDGIKIDRDKLDQLAEANKGRRGFTYTHYDVLSSAENAQAVKEANKAGFTVNLSANSVTEADELYSLGIGPVTTLLAHTTTKSFYTPMGRKVIICPAQTNCKITCKSCGICAKQRQAIVGFLARGKGKNRISEKLENRT